MTESKEQSPIELRAPQPGDIGWVIHRHGALYAAEHGWDSSFETLVGTVAIGFARSYDPAWERCWIATRGDDILGSAFVMRKDADVAKLRLVYVEPHARGAGLGRTLVEAAMAFARVAGYKRMTLWTNDVLLPARRLYQRLGFAMTAQEPHLSFGHHLVGETWERDL
jgi:GNAT superfamily N-acetyltransferase